MLAPAAALLVTLLALPVLRLDWQVMAWTLGTVAIGLVLYPVLQLCRQRAWFEFCGVSPHDFRCAEPVCWHCCE